jgi:hypothetical protein
VISDKQLDEYIAHTRAAFARGRVDVSIDVLALQSLLIEMKLRREVTAYFEAGYKINNVFVQRAVTAANNS